MAAKRFCPSSSWRTLSFSRASTASESVSGSLFNVAATSAGFVSDVSLHKNAKQMVTSP